MGLVFSGKYRFSSSHQWDSNASRIRNTSTGLAWFRTLGLGLDKQRMTPFPSSTIGFQSTRAIWSRIGSIKAARSLKCYHGPPKERTSTLSRTYGPKWLGQWTSNTSRNNELWGTLSKIWDQLNQNYLQTLCNSMINRLTLIKEVNGHWTKY
jgi:hypothetical protein